MQAQNAPLKESKEVLLRRLMSDQRSRAVVRKLSHTASCMHPDDVNAEFWRGVLLGLQSVRQIGDPISYLIQRGIWQVTSVIRDELNKKIVQTCIVCGRTNTHYVYDRRCQSCGASVENVYRSVPHDVDSSVEYVDFMTKLYVDDIMNRLPPNHARMFRMFIEATMMTDHPAAYVARRLGLSRERVRQYMVKIRQVALLVLTDADQADDTEGVGQQTEEVCNGAAI